MCIFVCYLRKLILPMTSPLFPTNTQKYINPCIYIYMKIHMRNCRGKCLCIHIIMYVRVLYECSVLDYVFKYIFVLIPVPDKSLFFSFLKLKLQYKLKHFFKLNSSVLIVVMLIRTGFFWGVFFLKRRRFQMDRKNIREKEWSHM